MKIEYNTKYYHDGRLHQLNPKRDSLWQYACSDGTIIGFFQGKKGLYKEVDFQIKVLLPGKARIMYTPAHWDWVADLLIKSHYFPEDVKSILEYFINFYDNGCIPFSTPEKRDSHTLKCSSIFEQYSHVVVERTLSIDALLVLMELFCYCEKRNEPKAHQFRDALGRMMLYCDGTAELHHVFDIVCSHFPSRI